jgi:NADH-quinone oxidoreductase subunit L
MRKMGGLRKKIPVTFWTMTAGTVAIAGIPPLAGFFSKDEILWRAYQACWVYWALGIFTAFLTSFYMFRLWFMTFFGEYRGDAESGEHGHDAHGHDAHGHDSHGHDSHSHGGIHESPKIMLVPLVVLAVLAVVGGWVGVPGALGGNNRFEQFLNPVFHASTGTMASEQTDSAVAAETPEPATGHGTERIFTGISVAGAFFGLYLAWLLYCSRPELPGKIATALGGFYQLVVHKYYVDELYAALFIKPLVAGSAKILWHGVDQNIIDATVDNTATGAREVSDSVRHMQSGNLRSYAGWITLGAAAVIAYMVWIGTQ